jgi:hypothetical protein
MTAPDQHPALHIRQSTIDRLLELSEEIREIEEEEAGIEAALAEVQALFTSGDRLKVEAVDRARRQGATWQDIAEAMGHSDRRAAQTWRARRK